MDALPVDKSIFRFVDGLVNSRTNNDTIFSYIDDPTVMGFNFVIDFNSKGNELFTQAANYLRSIDEPERANSLDDFTKRLKDLIFRFPYYFQSVSGLKELYKMDPAFGMRTKDRILEFKTLESIDLRVGNMIDKYMKAYFEEEYYREMIPQNLRRFSFWLVVSEIRNFKSYFTKVSQAAQYTQLTGQNTQDQPSQNYPSNGFSIRSINDMFNCYVYRFNNCEFDFSCSNQWMDELDQKGKNEFSTNSFRVKIGYMEEMHKMDLVGAMTGISNTSAGAYRKAIYGVPSDLGTISFNTSLAAETKLSGSSWLDKAVNMVKSTPSYQSLVDALDPVSLVQKTKTLAISAIQDITGNLLSSNVFDTVNGIINYDFEDAISKILDYNSGKFGGSPIDDKNVFGSGAAVESHFMGPQSIPGMNINDTSKEALLRESLNMDKDTGSPTAVYLGNVFGYRPIAGVLNSSLVAGAQAASSNNNSIN